MPRILLMLSFAAALLWFAADIMLSRESSPGQRAAIASVELEPVVPPVGTRAGFVADISVHTEKELDVLFTRLEQLLDRPRSDSEGPLVSLVLHGPEVRFFAFRNYAQYRDIVDRAAKLAALGAVDISICQTRMRNLDIQPDQVPAFLHQVPYGPGEVQRLTDKGYLTM